MVRKYITRDFTDHAYTTEYLSDEDEYVKFEVFSFDPKFTRIYSPTANTLVGENVNKTTFKEWICFQSKDKINPMEFTVDYKVTESGTYRVDIIYEKNTHMYNFNKDGTDVVFNTSKDLVGWYDVYTKGEKKEHKAEIFTDKLPKGASKSLKKAFEKSRKNAIKIANSSNTDKSDTARPLKFEGVNNAVKRKTLYLNLKEGSHKIEFAVPHNCYMYGVLIRKQITFYGSNNDEPGSNLMFTKAKLTFSEMGKASSLECTVGYDNSFECEESPSGLYLEYMDECNLYVKNNEGNIVRAFGGYVSTPLPDNTREEITIHSADRLKDGENKFILDLLLLQNGDSENTEYDKNNCISFDTYGGALAYLCKLYESSLNHNIDANHVEGEVYRGGFSKSFGKKKDIKKINVTNGQVTVNKNNITLRNNSSGKKKQVFTLYKPKKPLNISNYEHFHITCGLGNPKTEHKVKETITIDTADSTAGALKFGKCGVSQDKKYVMAIGTVSSAKDNGKYGTYYKTIFKNKCPHCGKPTLVWDSCRSDTNCVHTGSWGGSKKRWGVPANETEITCNHCDSDFSALGNEKDSPWKKLTKVGSTVKSSKAEQTKLHQGKMVALPKGGVAVTSKDIFKAIRRACKGWRHSTGTGTTASYLEKHHVGDCWAWSDWISKQLKKYKVNHKIVEYVTGNSDQHRSVLYQNSKGKYVDFPYREYGFPQNTRNTSGRKHGKAIYKYTAGGRINQATVSGSTNKTQTQETTITEGFDKDNPFKAFIDIVYSKSPKSKKYHIYLDFTEKASGNNTMTGLKPVWVNNSTKEISLNNFVSKLKEFSGFNTIYVHSISMVAPKIPVTKDNKNPNWYTVDNATKDGSSCKMYISNIKINNLAGTPPQSLDSLGKSVNELMQHIVEEAGYVVNMEYGLHRCDDKISFRITNSNLPVFTATEGDNNNILEWGNISYNPANELFNMSKCVFKRNNNTDTYAYVESKDVESIFKYQEQCTLMTINEKTGEKEAYWNARHNEKFNPVQTYDFTITVKGFPDLKFGELVKVVANMKKLNTLKDVKSIVLNYNIDDKPILQTELGLGELAPDIQIDKTIKQIRDSAKKETTYFHAERGAIPIDNEDIYEWEQ